MAHPLLRWLVTGLCLASLAGCGRALAPSPAARVLPAAKARAASEELIPGNRVALLQDAPQIFDAIEAAIRGARRSVQVHTFQLGGRTGLRIIRALAERQAAGVQVQVLTDPSHGAFGEAARQAAVCDQALREARLPHRDFDLASLPKGPTWLSRQGVVNHSKLVVVDGAVAILGGMNFYDTGALNRDYMVRIEGPAASRLAAITNADWALSGGPDGQVPVEEAAPAGPTAVALAETSARKRDIRDVLLRRFEAATRRIWIEMLFMDDDRLVEALARAKDRGVDVRVVLDPIDFGSLVPELRVLPFDGIPNWAAVGKLRDAGVLVSWFVPAAPRQNMHGKIAMVDDRWVLTGSANYTYRSFERCRESLVALDAPELAAAFAAIYQADEERARPVARLTTTQRTLAALFDKLKRGIYQERGKASAHEADL